MSSSPLVDMPPPERNTELLNSLTNIRFRVKESSSPNSNPTLLAVSKFNTASDILACHHDGQLDFGENYVQDLEAKARILPPDIRWHFIGTLQSNKAKHLAAIPNLYCVQTLPSIKVATALNKALGGLNPGRSSPLKVFIQINTSSEDSKSGLAPLNAPLSDLEDSELVKLVEYVISDCPQLRLEGLMTIGALESSVNAADIEKNADFDKLKETRDLLSTYLHNRHPLTNGSDGKWGNDGTLLLSMGMSRDFQTALKLGSDVVRVGTGIFGKRKSKST